MPDDRLGFLPPTHFTLDMLFFRLLFHELEANGYTRDGKAHVTVLRNISSRLLDALGLNPLLPLEQGFFAKCANAQHTWFSWSEMLEELRKDGHPSAPYNLVERLFVVMEMPDSCLLARINMILMMVVIIGNLTVLVLASLPADQCHHIIIDLEAADGKCGSHFQNFCMLVFSLEYVIKLCCSPFVRKDLFKQDVLLEHITADARHHGYVLNAPSAGPLHRLYEYIFEPANLIDLISILPAWVSVLVGTLLPPSSASFLRVLRVSRIFRILKTGRYLEMLQILAKVMIECSQSIVVLIVFLALVALIAGMILQQIEPENPVVNTVPQASYWIWANLLPMKEIPNFDGRIETWLGVGVFAIVLTMRQVLWTLPIGPIKSAFDDVSRKSKLHTDMKEALTFQLSRPAWWQWVGPTSSSPVHVRILKKGQAREDWSVVARATMPMPILFPESVDDELELPLHETAWSLNPFHTPATVAMRVRWNPYKAAPHMLPRGQLEVSVVGTRGLTSHREELWACRIKLLTGYAGRNAIKEKELVSSHPSKTPQLHGSLVYQVKWDCGTGSRELASMCSCELDDIIASAPTESTPVPDASPDEVLEELQLILKAHKTQLMTRDHDIQERIDQLAVMEKQLRPKADDMTTLDT